MIAGALLEAISGSETNGERTIQALHSVPGKQGSSESACSQDFKCCSTASSAIVGIII